MLQHDNMLILRYSVNVAIFQRSTGVHFNPANPPIMWEYTK